MADLIYCLSGQNVACNEHLYNDEKIMNCEVYVVFGVVNCVTRGFCKEFHSWLDSGNPLIFDFHVVPKFISLSKFTGGYTEGIHISTMFYHSVRIRIPLVYTPVNFDKEMKLGTT